MDSDFLKHIHLVDGRANSLADDMAQELEAVRERLMAKIAAVAGKLKTDWESTSLKKRKQLLELQRHEIEKILAEIYQVKMRGLTDEAARDVIAATASHTVTTMNSALGTTVKLGAGLSAPLIEKWFESSTVDGLLINEWLSKLEKAAADRIISVGRQALIEGLGIDSAARLMRTQGIQGSVPGLKGLARTFMLSASNYAKDTSLEKHFSHVMKGWRYSATLDRRTCIRCGVLDGKVYKLDAPKPSLPLHWQCRCTYLPVTKTFKELGVDVPEPKKNPRTTVKHSARKVNHKDGSTSTKWTVESVSKVKAGTTYRQWMKSQLEADPAFVRQVLGKTRFELFKSGKLILNQMVYQGRIKNLTELQA